MLGKLLKHEFKATARTFPLLYLATAVMGLLAYLGNQIDFLILSVTSSILLLLMGVACLIVTYVLIFTRFYKSMYGNEGYLSFTLPVKSSHLILSKFIVSIVWLMASSLAFAASMFGFFAFIFEKNQEAIGSMEDMLTQSGFQTGGILTTVILIFALIMIIQLVYFIAMVFASCTIANTSKFQKNNVLSAVLIFLVFYSVSQVPVLLSILFVPFGFMVTPSGVELTTQTMFSVFDTLESNSIVNVPIGFGSTIFEIIMIIVFLWLTAGLVKKKVCIK